MATEYVYILVVVLFLVANIAFLILDLFRARGLGGLIEDDVILLLLLPDALASPGRIDDDGLSLLLPDPPDP